MASYRVFIFEQALPDAIESGEHIRVVRERFSFVAFAFPFLWLLWHRLWVSLIVYIGLTGLFLLLGNYINPLLGLLLNMLLSFYIGLEADNLKAAKLTFNGWRERNIVLASDQEEAIGKAIALDFESPEPEISPSGQKGTFIQRPRPTRQAVIGGFPANPIPTGSRG